MSQIRSRQLKSRSRIPVDLSQGTNEQSVESRASTSPRMRACSVRRRAFTEGEEYGQGTSKMPNQISPIDLGIDKVTYEVDHGYILGEERHLREIIGAAGIMGIDGCHKSGEVSLFQNYYQKNRKRAVYHLHTKKFEFKDTDEHVGLELLFSAELRFIFIPRKGDSLPAFRITGKYTINPTRIRGHYPRVRLVHPFSLMWRDTHKRPLSLDGNDNWLDASTARLRDFARFTSNCVYQSVDLIRYSIDGLCFYLNNLRGSEDFRPIDASGLLSNPPIRFTSCECYLSVEAEDSVSLVNGYASSCKAYSNNSVRNAWMGGSNSYSMRFPNHILKLYAKLQNQARMEIAINKCSKALHTNVAHTPEECISLFENARTYAAQQINSFLNQLQTTPEPLSPDRLAEIFSPHFNEPGVRELFNLLVRRGSVAKADLNTPEGKQAFERFKGKPSRPKLLKGYGPNRRQYRYFVNPEWVHLSQGTN